jgi:hypothetical protein
MSERVPIRGPGGSRAVSRSASSPAAFSVPFLAGQKGDTSTGSTRVVRRT